MEKAPTTTTPTQTPDKDTKKRIAGRKSFTATVVTFALTALLCFMACFILITGAEDNNGVVASAVVVANGAIQFYFGTKQGGNNG
jgi:hypothetical protein